jgi:hypothetical protein
VRAFGIAAVENSQTTRVLFETFRIIFCIESVWTEVALWTVRCVANMVLGRMPV